MGASYDLEDYLEDVKRAQSTYTAAIREECEVQGAPVPLDDQGIYQAKAKARGCKNQVLSAAGKRLRAGVALRLLDQLQGEFDLTATFAVRITEKLLGRAIDRKLLLSRYGTEQRTAAKKSADFRRMAEIVDTPAFVESVAELEAKLEAAREIRDQVKREQSQKGEAYKMLSRSAKAYGGA